MIDFESVSKIELEENEMLVFRFAEAPPMDQIAEFVKLMKGTPLEGRCIFLGPDVSLAIARIEPVSIE